MVDISLSHPYTAFNLVCTCVYNINTCLLKMQHAAATLGSGNLKLAVQLPDGEDMNEWVAVNSELYEIEYDAYT